MVRKLWRFEAHPGSLHMAPLRMELAAELGIPRPRYGAVVRLVDGPPIQFSSVEVDGIIDRCEQYRPRVPDGNPECGQSA